MADWRDRVTVQFVPATDQDITTSSWICNSNYAILSFLSLYLRYTQILRVCITFFLFSNELRAISRREYRQEELKFVQIDKLEADWKKIETFLNPFTPRLKRF